MSHPGVGQQQVLEALLPGLGEALSIMEQQLLPVLTSLHEAVHNSRQQYSTAAGQVNSQPQRQQQLPAIMFDQLHLKEGLLPELAAALEAAGRALCAALPCRFCCNNPDCSNMDGVSEAFGLVRGKACVCGGCLGVLKAREAPGAPEGAVAARWVGAQGL